MMKYQRPIFSNEGQDCSSFLPTADYDANDVINSNNNDKTRQGTESGNEVQQLFFGLIVHLTQNMPYTA